MKHGKKYVDGAKLIERSRLYDTQEALDLCVKTGTAKFDETVEVHVKLGVAVMQTSRSAVLSSCRTARARPSACSQSASRRRKTRLVQPVLNSSAAMI